MEGMFLFSGLAHFQAGNRGTFSPPKRGNVARRFFQTVERILINIPSERNVWKGETGCSGEDAHMAVIFETNPRVSVWYIHNLSMSVAFPEMPNQMFPNKDL